MQSKQCQKKKLDILYISTALCWIVGLTRVKTVGVTDDLRQCQWADMEKFNSILEDIGVTSGEEPG